MTTMANMTRVRRKGPSIEDVARLAGVSAQTVSRVSTGSASVRPTTRDRVLTAMNQLGYSPNRAARALRSGSFGSIGIITQRLERTGEALTTAAVVRAAEAHDLSATLIHVEDPGSDGLEHAASRLTDQAVDGLVIVRVWHASRESLVLPDGLPVAVSDSRLMGHHPSVDADQVGGSAAAVEHLLSLGHRNIHHIAGPEGSQPALVRRATWQRCLQEAGLPTPRAWEGDWSGSSGYRIGQHLLTDESVTAVYCANDEMAFGLIRALHEGGRRVPEDVSVVGFDGIDLSEFSYPPLTTVRQDFRRIGEELVRLVMEQIQSRVVRAPTHVVLPTQLLIRGTTAPPPPDRV